MKVRDLQRGRVIKVPAALVAVLLAVLLGACTPTPKSTVRNVQVEALGAYDTVFIGKIVTNDGVRDQYGLERLLANALEAAGFKVYFEDEVPQTSIDPLRALQLGVGYYWTRSGFGSYATVDLVLWDGFGTESFRSQGTHVGPTLAADAQGAARKAAQGIAAAYPGFNSEVASLGQRRVAEWPRGLATAGEVRANLSAGNRDLDPLEGIWASEDGRFSIGIYPAAPQSGVDFVGSIVGGEHESWVWRGGMVRFEATRTSVPGRYTIRYWNDWLERVGQTIEIHDGLMVISNVPGYGSGPSTDQVMVKSYPAQTVSPKTSEPAQADQKSVSGSGFLISETGLVVTNSHVVEGTSSITVHLAEGSASYMAEVVLNDVNNDIAVLQLVGFDYGAVFDSPIPYALGDSDATAVGQDVLAIGFPLSSLLGPSIRVTNGIISARTGVRGAPNVFQISNPVQPGNSGGPLLNMYGEVVGVVVASLDAGFVLGAVGTLPQNVNFAVKSSYIRNLLGMLPDSSDVLAMETRTEALQSGSLVAAATPFIALIQAE